ncbi:hypothetical protein [Pseudofrankia sp. DC12]|uniref:hypothetical protein n=1 Tax=Pseudofrankia sp. DC12 TaxID=683315 RepID=UPI0005F7D9A2|nr:hypothetical protein [Pseudofrankia sp. DC12]
MSHVTVSDVFAVAVCLVLLAAALGGMWLLLRPPLTAVRTVEGVRAIEVRLADGRVEIGEDERTDTRVDLTVRRRVGRTVPRLVMAGGTLRLDGETSEARLRLRLPPATPARVELRAGEVSLWGSAGDLELLTETATIAGRELSGRHVTARSETGDVNLHFTGAPERLAIAGGPGTVTVVLPDGRYAVEVESADPSNIPDVDVPTDPAAPHAVLVRSDGGRVRIAGAVAGGALPI